MSRGLERLLFASPEGIPGEKVDARLHGRLSDPIPSVDDPNVDRDSLTRYLRSRKAAILGCYEKEVRKHGARNGRLVLHFNMTRLGRAADIAIEEDTTHNQDIGACVKAIARGWVFPFKPEGNVPVTVPFLFTRAL